MSQLTWLHPQSLDFPSPEQALDDPNGLLAMGGDLSPARLEKAYRQGIFPWYQEGQPLLWWSPDPRTVLFPEDLHLSRSMRKFLGRTRFRVTFDQDFPAVIAACAEPRDYTDATWITRDMQDAYCQLHLLGMAHSVEVWDGSQLVGGLYGVALGRVFFGESMFSRRDNASKTAFVELVRRLQASGFDMIDCQMPTDHLFSLGAQAMSRDEFQRRLKAACDGKVADHWQQSD
ncbi:MAG TPA: leucyl/phenylalanyl-tRNA--protein transferase [Pseudomonas xinjiangensis]|uniref:Leucyl/phenylalanyl-tRNA--protein transferase n=2 Tax=root TaxID=1 RepID=A0A7V1FQT6_9GAMM|nr:leucyl/phenylalanyl-tRNA--protein transferase [Halopseudomonas xinjiangensis]HEC47107.1 leucyl/phenylalanyl-tRNA--protein transferase [Halopseudomonas xinjiangensis]